jgi:hypothetical protein
MKTNSDKDELFQDVRTDLWKTMTISQLYHQHELLLNKIAKLQSILTLSDNSSTYGGQDSSTMSLYKVLRQAALDLGYFIEAKSSTNRAAKDIPKVTL